MALGGEKGKRKGKGKEREREKKGVRQRHRSFILVVRGGAACLYLKFIISWRSIDAGFATQTYSNPINSPFMQKFIRTVLFLALSLFTVNPAAAQKKLSDSPDTSGITLVYRLSRESLRELNVKGRKISDKHLREQVCSYDRGGNMPKLPRGNYVTVAANGGKLVYAEHIVDDMVFGLTKGEAPYLELVDSRGVKITDAVVHVGNSRCKYSAALGAYPLGKLKDGETIEVDNKGVCHYIDVYKSGSDNKRRGYRYRAPFMGRRWWSRLWYKTKSVVTYPFRGGHSSNSGFVVFNKPKYRPGEKVKVKAYVTDNKGRPAKRPLNVALLQYYPDRIDTVLTTLSPYRPGMYAYEFDLTDSLGLKLDARSQVSFIKPGPKTRVWQTGSFFYEDYELGKVVFDATLGDTKKEYLKGDKIKLTLSAKDHNNLPVYDGRVTIVAKPSSGKVAKETVHIKDRTFIADTMWRHSVNMANAADREVILPDSLFPEGVSLGVSLECEYLGADNEKQSKTVKFFRNASDYTLDYEFAEGKLHIRELSGTQEVDTDAVIVYYNHDGDIIMSDSVRLPYFGAYPWFVSEYRVVTPHGAHSFEIGDVSEEPVRCSFYKEGGDVRLSVANPLNLPAWYTILEDKKVIGKGRVGDELDISRKARGKKPYSMQVSYLYGGEGNVVEQDIPYVRPNITTSVSTPTAVYPGQTAEVEIAVGDKKGRPVRGADVTAYAITSAFDNKGVNVPIYGKKRSARQFSSLYFEGEVSDSPWNTPMQWDEWKEKLGLDTMEYYRFLYPSPVYMTREQTPGETSISVFAMVDGNPQGIQVLYIDRHPYYFHGADHPDKQTFAVDEGFHYIQVKTHDRTVKLDKVYAVGGTKTIISVKANDDSEWEYPGIADRITVRKQSKKMARKLSANEVERLSEYMISVRDYSHSLEVAGGSVGLPYYLRSGGRVYPLVRGHNYYFSSGSNSFLAGPFPPNVDRSGVSNRLELFADTLKVNEFGMEGGYDYWVGEGYLKLKEWKPNTLKSRLNPFIQPVRLKERAEYDLPDNSADALVMELLAGCSGEVSSYGNYHGARLKSGRDHRLELEFGKDASGAKLKPALILFEKGDSADWYKQLFFGNTRVFKGVPYGDSEMSVIMTDSTVYKAPVSVQQGGRTFIRIDSAVCVPDTAAFVKAFMLLDGIIRKSMPDPANDMNRFDYLNFYADRQFDEVVLQKGHAEEGMVTGVVRDGTGAPVLGASIVIQGTTTGTVTGMDGRFKIAVEGSKTLQISFIGYETVTSVFDPGRDYEIIMGSSLTIVPDIVVTGMVAMDKRMFSGATDRLANRSDGMVDLSRGLEGRSAGVSVQDVSATFGTAPNIRIRGATSIMGSATPLIVVDGVIMDAASLEELGIDASMIASFDVLKDSSATSVYGARAANGVIVVKTFQGKNVLSGAQQQEGEQSFPDAPMQSMRRNFHDDAFWQPSLKTDRHGKASFEVTYPDDLTSWNAQVITVAGRHKSDSRKLTVRSYKFVTAQLSMPRFAVEGDSINMIGKLTSHMADTINVISRWVVLGDSVEHPVRLMSSHVDTMQVTVPEGADSLRAVYSLMRDNGYSDGEERVQPVMPRGILETNGEFRVLADTGAFRFSPDPELGPVTVHAATSALDIFLEEIENVASYPYMCNEQASSKLKAMLAKKKIYAALGMKFEEDKTIKALISRLAGNKNSEGLWGWWGGNRTEPWISYQVIEALLDARSDGYDVDIQGSGVRRALMARLDRAISGKTPDRTEAARLLNVLKRLDAEINYRAYGEAISGMPVAKDIKPSEIILYTRAAVEAGITERPSADSIMKLSTRTLKGSLYWGGDAKYRHVFTPATSDVELTLAAYRILGAAEGYENELQGIRNYFFEKRRNGRWVNIYQSSRILETILPEMIDNGGVQKLKLTVNGSETTSFPFTTQLDGQTEVVVNKNGIEPVFVTAYQQHWNKSPKPENEGFEVVTAFASGGKEVASLVAGQTAELTATVRTDSSEEFVMIEIPIPAGCSYEEKSGRHSRYEVHREHFRDKVSIFCRDLPKGEHSFTIKLLPRYSGVYNLNPAEVKLMYYPTFYGHNDVKKVAIGEDGKH